MSRRKIFLGALFIFMFLGFFSSAMAAVHSRDGACDLLKKVASRKHLVAKGVSLGEYVCENHSENGDYFIFGLHYKLNKPGGRPQSNLVGWFAVAKKDGSVYEWDMANLSLGRPVDGDH